MCEPGSLFHSDDGIEADAVMGGCCNAIKRSCCAGEDLFRVHYTNKSNVPRTLTLTSPYPSGKLIGVDLNTHSGMTMKKSAWSASMGRTEFGYRLAKNLTAGCCAGQGLVLTTIKGSGTAFLNAGGTVFQRELGPGESITVDTQSLVACSASVDIGVRRAGSMLMMCCGGEGLFVCKLTGPGLVIIQSMPVEKAAMVYHKYMPKAGPEPPTPPRPLRLCTRHSSPCCPCFEPALERHCPPSPPGFPAANAKSQLRVSLGPMPMPVRFSSPSPPAPQPPPPKLRISWSFPRRGA